MRILEQRALRGPNIWSRFPTAYMRLDLEDFAERPTTTFPGFTDLLMKLSGPGGRVRESHARRNLAGARH